MLVVVAVAMVGTRVLNVWRRVLFCLAHVSSALIFGAGSSHFECRPLALVQ